MTITPGSRLGPYAILVAPGTDPDLQKPFEQEARSASALITSGGKGYAYCCTRLLSDLFIVEELR